MDTNILGICITALLSFLAIAVAIFLGLHAFTKDLGEKVASARDGIIEELSGISERIIRIEDRADDIWEFAKAYISGTPGTIERTLKNFGKTKISAQPGKEETTYTIRVEKGMLNTRSISKASKETGFTVTSLKLLGEEAKIMSFSPSLMRIVLPSTDSKVCTQYMSKFLKWLDSEYVDLISREIRKFEDSIEV